jgi:hypothetical protein
VAAKKVRNNTNALFISRLPRPLSSQALTLCRPAFDTVFAHWRLASVFLLHPARDSRDIVLTPDPAQLQTAVHENVRMINAVLNHFVLEGDASRAKQEESLEMLVLEGAALGLLLFGQAEGAMWTVDWDRRRGESENQGGEGGVARLVVFPGLKKVVRRDGRSHARSVVKPSSEVY